jgi:uncharacterized cofD-like protein
MVKKKLLSVVVIGGGTGTATVLTALSHDPTLTLTALVTVSDSGGSTGRLRDEFGFIPVGDIRQCLAALASGENCQQVRDLLLYRFTTGGGLAGHNLGNLILTALSDLYHTPGQAIAVASKILRINGQVFPISEQAADLVITYANGQQVVGEDYLNYKSHGGKRITALALTKPSQIYAPAATALAQADLIIIGPGDLYASLLPHTLITGFKTALQKASAPMVYIVNLMTNYAQTHQLTARDHVAEICRYSGREPDYIIVNQQKITDQILIASYQAQGAAPLVDDLGQKYGRAHIIRGKLVAPVLAASDPGDRLPRNYLRHHGAQLQQIIRKILDENC